MKVKDIMNTSLVTVGRKDDVRTAARLMNETGVGSVAVTETDGGIAGIITDGDIRRAMQKWQAEFFDHTVADIMTREPKTVLPNVKVSEIQRIMHRYKIHSVLVCDKEKRLLGIVDSYASSML